MTVVRLGGKNLAEDECCVVWFAGSALRTWICRLSVLRRLPRIETGSPGMPKMIVQELFDYPNHFLVAEGAAGQTCAGALLELLPDATVEVHHEISEQN